MKKYLFLFITLIQIQFIYGQCVADAGPNQHRCSPDSIIILGSDPALYIYEWSMDPIPFIPPTFPYLHASDILDDTTNANPTIVYNGIDSLVFYLKVTDSLGCTAYDTCLITTSHFNQHIYTYEYFIELGDSVYLNEYPNIGGGYGESTYEWSPSHGLSDTTLFSGFWAKPEHSVNYTAAVTDSKGCYRIGGGPTYFINVGVSGHTDESAQFELTLYPNPAEEVIFIGYRSLTRIEQIRVLNISGQEMLVDWDFDKIAINNLPKGMYIVEIQTPGKTLYKKIVKE